MARTATEAKTAEAKAAEKPEEKANYYDELVEVHLFKDNDKYSKDQFVAHNGHRYLIKRGETVKVPRKVALILERSLEQDSATAQLISEISH